MPIATLPLLAPKREFPLPDDDDVEFVRTAITALGLAPSFISTPACLETLRVTTLQKELLEAALLKCSESGDGWDLILDEIKCINTSLNTAMWSLSSEDITPVVCSASREDLLRVLIELKELAEKAIVDHPPTEISLGPADFTSSLRDEGRSDEHLPYRFADPRHRDDPVRSPDEREAIGQAELAAAKASGIEGVAVYQDERELKRQRRFTTSSRSCDPSPVLSPDATEAPVRDEGPSE